MSNNWQCRIAPSLGGGFAGTPNECWGTVDYTNQDDPVVFFGLYGLPDFYTLWRHKGKKYILWAGSDVRHFINGYFLEDNGEIRIAPRPLAEWIIRNCESYVENRAEYDALKKLGIESKIVPSFLGNVNDYQTSFKPGNRVYASVSGDNFVLYGFHDIEMIAEEVPEITFFLYGSNDWKTVHKNVIVRGRVSQEIMNQEIMEMQAGFRPLFLDGCSEVIVKSALWGHHTISRIKYPFLDSYTTQEELIKLLKDLPNKKEPNLDARNWFLKNLNQYPWNAERNT